MTILDWFIVLFYIAFLIGLGFYLNALQDDTDDYYLAGQSMKWWQTGFSTMATQLSAVSFISIPAFVGIQKNGGLKWLAYEFSVPLALILVMAVIIPILHRNRYISMHQLFEDRFGTSTRSIMSFAFLFARGLATGVVVLAGAKVAAVVLQIKQFMGISGIVWAILGIGVITILYDVMGGIGVVIISDIIQMGLIMVGMIACGWVGYNLLGSWDPVVEHLSPERANIMINDWGIHGDEQYGFWPFLLGGFFLYVAYYGCDQSQVQREMAVGDEDEVRKSMLLNAFARFPIVVIYCTVGLIVGTVFSQPELSQEIASSLDPGFLQLLAEEAGLTNPKTAGINEILSHKGDYMLPMFILSMLPPGLVGLLIAGVLAALMSSLDSALNSLSAVTMKDFYQKFLAPDQSQEHYLLSSKIITLSWGVFAVLMAIVFQKSQSKTIVELINLLGSIFYGTFMATFLLAILTNWVKTIPINVGLLTGLIFNFVLALPLLFPDTFSAIPSFSWLWLNVTGFFLTAVPAVLFSLNHIKSRLISYPSGESDTSWIGAYTLCFLYFLLILVICFLFEQNMM